MRKKVVREERLGNSAAVKVIYDDGTWGIRGIPSESDETIPAYVPPPPTVQDVTRDYAQPPPTMPMGGKITATPLSSPEAQAPMEPQEADMLDRYMNTMTDTIDRDEKDLLVTQPDDKAVSEAYNQMLLERVLQEKKNQN